MNRSRDVLLVHELKERIEAEHGRDARAAKKAR